MNDKTENFADVNRRDFLKGGSFATLMTLLGGVQLIAQAPAAAPAPEVDDADKIGIGVIGAGPWGREIIGALTRLNYAKVVMVCDTYPAMVRRATTAAPGSVGEADYQKVLANPDVKAVIIATPTHQHKEIVVAALQAGKHVYCEAPLAHTVDDARAIALAAKANPQVVFQPGLQMRSDPQRHFLLPFIRAGSLGRTVMARSQWHKKTSWRSSSPNGDREREINWRLRKDVSLGLAGEIGIHQLDAACWYLNALPESTTGFGSTILWTDGRETNDTIQSIVQFPKGVNFTFDITLANSFDAEYEMYYGSEAAVMLRDSKAWMFKEVDAPLLGWEVYARKDSFYKEVGIALAANATKLVALGTKAVDDAPNTSLNLYTALENFVSNVRDISAAVEDFNATFAGADKAALVDYLKDIKLQPAASYVDGFEATITAIKANEAIVTGQRVAIDKSLYQLG